MRKIVVAVISLAFLVGFVGCGGSGGGSRPTATTGTPLPPGTPLPKADVGAEAAAKGVQEQTPANAPSSAGVVND